MITAAERQELVEWVQNLENTYILQQLRELKNSGKDEFEANISEELKKDIDKGIEDVKQGRVYTHEEVMEQTRKKYPKLFTK
jgi:hypothetical protein